MNFSIQLPKSKIFKILWALLLFCLGVLVIAASWTDIGHNSVTFFNSILLALGIYFFIRAAVIAWRTLKTVLIHPKAGERDSPRER